MSVAPIAPVALPIGSEGVAAPRPAGGPAFGDVLGDAITSARARESSATELAQRFADGDPTVGIHETVIAAEKANVSLRYATTLKNKLVEAYRELMATQV